MKHKTSNHLFLFFLFFFQLVINSLYSQEKKYSPEIEKKITEVENNLGFWVNIEGASNKKTLQQQMDFYHVNGVSIAVVKDYKIEWSRGYGWADRATQSPVTTGTLFQSGSISKSINGIGILKLVQEKHLNLDTDINEYLKSWKFPYDSLCKGKKITLAALLSHTAGLKVYGFPGYEKGSSIPTINMILDGKKPAVTPAVRSAFEPGLKFQYSGGGITISQAVLQDVTAKPYDVFMLDSVLNPMGMKNSFYSMPISSDKQNVLATAYKEDGNEIKGKYHIYPEQAAAGLWTNPTDLASYIIETQLALQGKSNKVLSQEMTKIRLTPFTDSESALGVFINKKGEQTYFQHGGKNEGFVAQYYGSMEGGNGVVVMANTSNTSILMEIINSVAVVYDWKRFYEPQLKKVIEINNDILETYLGDYKIGNIILSIKKSENGIIIRQGKEINKLNFISDTDFFLVEKPGDEFTFTINSLNQVDGLNLKKGKKIIRINKI
jgi:CubicO group peptidase (beta-lactamase class C family)